MVSKTRQATNHLRVAKKHNPRRCFDGTRTAMFEVNAASRLAPAGSDQAYVTTPAAKLRDTDPRRLRGLRGCNDRLGAVAVRRGGRRSGADEFGTGSRS